MKRLSDAANQYMASILRNISQTDQRLVENTVSANEDLQTIRDVFFSEWYNALSEFDEEFESLGSSPDEEDTSRLVSALQVAWIAALQAALFRSFRMGYGKRGRPDTSTMTPERIFREFPQFEDVINKHSGFASQFAKQYASGYTDLKGKLGFPARINLYGAALKSAYNAGAVFGGNPGEKIFWRLGSCDHCVDCPALSVASPYTRNTLPTLPGNGDTLCKTNCCCYLVFVNGPRVLEPDDTVDSWLEEALTEGKTCSHGCCDLTESEEENMSSLQDVMLRRQYMRRSKSGKGSSLDSEIDSLSKGVTLKSKSRYNPGSVITRADISQTDVNRILAMGMDGPSIFRGSVDKAINIIDKVALDYGKPEALKSIKAPKIKDREPAVASTSVVNIVGDGMIKTLLVLKSIIKLLNEVELFVTVGALDDSMQRIVGFSGVWIKGDSNEVDTLVQLLEDSGLDFRLAEVLRL
jgi:hypothetical protein